MFYNIVKSAVVAALLIGVPLMASAQNSRVPNATAASPPVSPAVDVIVKPIEPPANANELPQEVGKVLTTLAEGLTRISQTLEARQNDVALCWAANKTGPLGAPPLYECLARTAAETKATWDTAVDSFKTFGQGLTKIGAQIDEVKTYVAGQQRDISEQRHVLETGIAKARGQLQLVKVALGKKALTPEQERDVRKVIDDVLTGYMKTGLLKQRQNFFDQTSQRLVAYRGLVDELQGENDVLGHQSRNRTDAWAAILEGIQSQASIAILDERFSCAFR
jgi:hypothetical protein